MPFSGSAEAQSLDALASAFGSYSSVIAYASLHSAYDAAGGSELSGGSYARVALTWGAASAGSGTKALSVTPSAFSVPASSTVAFIGLWSQQTGGTFAGMGANGGHSMYAFTATDGSPAVFTAPGSAYNAGQTVVLFPGVSAGGLPAPFTAGTVYYVAASPAPSGATFSLAATSSGAAVDSSGAGSGLVQAIAVEVYASGGGTFQLSAETLAIQ